MPSLLHSLIFCSLFYGEPKMKVLKQAYKVLAVVLLFYALFAGLLKQTPDLPALGDSIRNLFYHVGMWFAMIILLLISVISSIGFLKNQKNNWDLVAVNAVNAAMVFGLLGILTGMVWAKISWGQWWVNDPKLNGAVVTILAYAAYKVLRSAMKDPAQKARIAAVYNILAFAMMLVFMMILPRTATGSIHPGQGGNPALNPAELDDSMRLVFYPAILGWILLSVWILELTVRVSKLKQQSENT
jgi:heme exporter protein C